MSQYTARRVMHQLIPYQMCDNAEIKDTSSEQSVVPSQDNQSKNQFKISQAELKCAAPTSPRECQKSEKRQHLLISDGSSASDSITITVSESSDRSQNQKMQNGIKVAKLDKKNQKKEAKSDQKCIKQSSESVDEDLVELATPVVERESSQAASSALLTPKKTFKLRAHPLRQLHIDVEETKEHFKAPLSPYERVKKRIRSASRSKSPNMLQSREFSATQQAPLSRIQRINSLVVATPQAKQYLTSTMPTGISRNF